MFELYVFHVNNGSKIMSCDNKDSFPSCSFWLDCYTIASEGRLVEMKQEKLYRYL